MSFESVAKEIVRDSIRSAVCVDNAFVEPYTDPIEGDDEETPKKLYHSFRKEDCNLDIYRYEDILKWKLDKEYILKNHDLLILDWELTGDPPFKDALEILWEVINLPSLHFVVIYTQEQDTFDIELNIRSFFGVPYEDMSERRLKYEEFCDKLEDEFDNDVSRLFESLVPECTEYILKNQKTVRNNLINSIQKHCETEDLDYKKFMKNMVIYGKSILEISNIENLFEFIGYYFKNTLVNPKDSSCPILKIEDDKQSFLINNTTVTIFKKPKTSDPNGEFVISPEKVYSHFSESIYKRPRNFLALLALEMKNVYRENSGNIGSELYDINEFAFFHHQENLDSEDDFYDFLRNCWKDQLSAFNYLYNPKLFSVLEEYKNKINYEIEIDNYRVDEIESFRKELVKLNYQYSFLKIKRKENDRIRFGDLFLLSKNENVNQSNGYILCITPNCDCLHTENVKNKLHFVFANKIPIEDGLNCAEKGFHSFLIYSNEPLCIKWNGKPFTLYIPEDNNNISKPIQVKYHDSEHYLHYVDTQKDNYTQRIANEAFSHASRVGVELAGFKIEN